ncbi:Transmembrane protein 14C [Galemys pyrenaicus]|uniref:Transmembrane protein 14C n=1 Tax=Galemys pyrenaicus TaxID=202257 RepID=A0A8J6DHB0_GALPY|nr:Transmembrane protein 14C [Galemys pyrenaicus]
MRHYLPVIWATLIRCSGGDPCAQRKDTMHDSGPLVPLHWIGFGYAALVASGGIIGYAKAGSVPSLAAGLLFGGLAGLGAYQLSQDPRNVWVFLATSGTLAGIMGIRFYNSGKFMPAGLIAGARLTDP